MKAAADLILIDVKFIDKYVAQRKGVMAMAGPMALEKDLRQIYDYAPIPRGTSSGNWLGRLSALADSRYDAHLAFGKYQDSKGYATHTVIRRELKPILDSINRALGTSYRLPPR